MSVRYDDLKILAEEHYEDSKQLWNANRFNGSVYMIGYSLELALKATICKLLNIDEYLSGDHYKKAFLTHDLQALLKLAGLEKELNNDPRLSASWAIAVEWNPEMRYTVVSRTKQEVSTRLKGFIEIFRWLKIKW